MMAEEQKKSWEEGFEAQVNALNSIERSFGAFAQTLRERHTALENEVPKIEDAVTEIKTTLESASRKSERAAQEINATADRLIRDSGGQFAAWQGEAAKVRSELDAVAKTLTDNVQEVQRTLAGVQEALVEIKSVEETVFGGIKNAVDGVKAAVDRNTRAKVGDVAGALQQATSVSPEDMEKIRGEIESLRSSIDSAKQEIIAAKPLEQVPPAQDVGSGAAVEDVQALSKEVSEIKSMLFEMVRYMKDVSEREPVIPNVEVKPPEPPPPGTAEELAERMASGYRDLVKLMANKS